MSNGNEEQRVLLAGAARSILALPIGIRMWGYTVQEDFAQSVERDMTATVLILGDGETFAVIAAIDVLFVPMPHADRIREAISRELGIPAANILLSGSHTHLGPMLPGWAEEAPPQRELQAQALAEVEAALRRAAQQAWANRQPARIGSAKGAAPLGVNRREKMPDGSVIVGENIDGPIDRTVDVLRIDDLQGQTLAVVMSAACHTIVLGPKSSYLSPDFIGPAREIIEEHTGGMSLFLQGAAGNINPVCGIGAGGAEQLDDCRRLGAILGGEVLKVWSQIQTTRRRGERRIVRSVAALSVWDYEPAPRETVFHFAVDRRRLVLPLSPFPTAGILEADLARARADAESAANGGSIGARNVANRKLAYAEQRWRLSAAGVTTPTREIEIWAMRLNNIGIAAVSAEPLAELGLEIKRRSPLAHTLFLGYSNGCIGYIPPPAAFAEGGMEVVESHVNYLLAAQLTPAWAPIVVDSVVDLLGAL